MRKDNKKFVIDTKYIKYSLSKELNINEFLLLMYFENEYDPIFDINIIQKFTSLKEESIMEAFSSLVLKKIINVELGKNESNKTVEKIVLNDFYDNLKTESKKTEKKETTKDIFSIFEEKFGRTLSGMDFEIIKAWIEKDFKEEIILEALNEASYNGVTNLRYIDKILYDWNKKGIKTKEDLTNKNQVEKEEEFETSILNFDWLDNE